MQSSWWKTAGLLIAVGLTLAACEQVKPVVTFEPILTLEAPVVVVRGGERFPFTARLSYRDESGQEQPLAGQVLHFEATDFALPAQAVTDAQGQVSFELEAPLLPERERERPTWIRASFAGTVIEFADKIARFVDRRNDRYFKIVQQAPGRNPPGLPGRE